MAWDPQAYYQDPYAQAWGQEQYYDPNYAYDKYYGYDPYYGYYQQEPQSDTESEKLRKDQAEKERIEQIESNRIYLQKIKKQCVKEDFVNLQQLRLFLFEVLIESLEVNSEPTLGLLPDIDPEDSISYITARVQFLNSPYLEICEKDMVIEGTPRESEMRQTEYTQTIGEAGLYDVYDSSPQTPESSPVSPESNPETPVESETQEDEEPEIQYTTRWENASGKSCLFSMTALTMIQDLEHYPVNLQVARSVVTQAGPEVSEPLGYARVRLPEDFSLSVLQSMKPGVVLPVSSVHRDTCILRNVFGVKKGKVQVFVRLSSFGPAIITSFQTVGVDRRYIFKPSPMATNSNQEEEELPRNEVLKPIIADEGTACGITAQKEEDIFQRPVLWQKGSPSCGCKDEGNSLYSGPSHLERASHFSRSSMRLPQSSEMSLCRDVRPPTDARNMKQFGKPLCDWHNLVGLEIKNSPGGNCGCLDLDRASGQGRASGQSRASGQGRAQDRATKELIDVLEADDGKPPKDPYEVSRVMKMLPRKQDKSSPTGGLGLKPKDSGCNCNCDCPAIRDSLQRKKLFLI